MLAAARMPRPIHAVDEQDVLKPVVVVVDEGAAGAERFRQIFAAESAAVMIEVDAARFGDIGESKPRSSLGAE